MREVSLSHQIRTILKTLGLDADPESAHGQRGSIDILIKFETHKIAIECERLTNSTKAELKFKRGEAVKDAVSRLDGKNNSIHSVIALIIPATATIDNITQDTIVSYITIHLDDAEFIRRNTALKKHSYSKIASKFEWHDVTLYSFASVLRNIAEDIGKPEILAQQLKQKLQELVQTLSKDQQKNLAMVLNLYHNTLSTLDLQKAAKRALLIIASASMFHARLDEYLPNMKPVYDARTGKYFRGVWPPNKLRQCVDANNSVTSLLDSWNLILAVDYKPIFETGCAVLQMNTDPTFVSAVKNIAHWACIATGQVGGRRHDLLGKLFHAVLPDARNDGSYYTTMSTATLLASLALQNRQDVPKDLSKFRIIDPACGTGTLLMASANRLRELCGSSWNDDIYKDIIEKVLIGIDINHTATHMAATSLGLLSPRVLFKNMNIFKAEFGKGRDGSIRVGSLELYENNLLNYEGMPSPAKQIDKGTKKATVMRNNDLVIMNPPFSRKDLRYHQLTPDIRSAIKKREKQLFKDIRNITSFDSSGPSFLALAERLVTKDGTVATVFPLSFLRAPSVSDLRKYIAAKFYIEIIVISYDNKKFSFSETTNISEMLMILKPKSSKNSKRSTSIVNLSLNPTTSGEAAKLAHDIKQNTSSHSWHIRKLSNNYVVNGDYTGTQFYSSILFDKFKQIYNNEIFSVVNLGDLANIGYQGRTVPMYFEVVDSPIQNSIRTLWYHTTNENDADSILSISAVPYTYITPKKGQEDTAEKYFKKMGRLLLPERFVPNTVRATCVRTELPTIGGSAWTPIMLKQNRAVELLGTKLPSIKNSKDQTKMKSHETYKMVLKKPKMNKDDVLKINSISKTWEKAMAVWFNSTLGIVQLFGMCIVFKLPYPKLSEFAKIKIPVLNKTQIKDIAMVFDENKNKHLMPLTKITADTTRHKFDTVLCNVLDISDDVINTIRYELCREPMISSNLLNTNNVANTKT